MSRLTTSNAATFGSWEGVARFLGGFFFVAWRLVFPERLGIIQANTPRHCEQLIAGGTQMKTSPWHSVKEPHHHDNTKCGPGSEIPAHNRIQGTGSKPLCKDCAKLDKEGK